jgi:hypothetical protein
MIESEWKNYIPISEKNSISDILSEVHLFYEYNHGDFFLRTKEEVLSAEYRLNLKFSITGYASLNDFYELLYLPKTDIGASIGWAFGNDLYRYPWIDFTHELVNLEDGMECYVIDMPNPPESDYLYL